MKTVLAIRHVPFQDLGLLAPLLAARGYRVRYHDIGVDDLAAVDPGADDLLVVLGGPNDAGDALHYPFLAEVLALVRARLDLARPLLGICLGAQLMSLALGASVTAMPELELGWEPLELTAAGTASCLGALGPKPEVLCWHRDVCGLPAGATLLARSRRCDNQAFSYGGFALALQFHPEPDPQRFEQWLVGNALQLAAHNIDPRGLRADNLARSSTAAQQARALLNAWLDSLPIPAFLDTTTA